jgi:hypothetical protein
MSPRFGATSDHDRATELAAIRIDEPLAPDETAWLDAHLAVCDACAATADAYDADRMLFAPLRGAPPQPPRDLWARTAAAIDAEAGVGRARGRRGTRRFSFTTFAPLAGLAVVAVLVGGVLLRGTPVAPPVPSPGAAATPIAVTPGDVAVLTRTADGSYRLQTSNVNQVCPLTQSRCDASPSFESTMVAQIGGSDSVGAIISPSRDRLVVVQRSKSGADGVFVVPVRAADTVTTPSPAAATASTATAPTGSPTPAVASTASPTPSVVPATSSPESSSEPSVSPASGSPDASPSITPSQSATEPPPTTRPTVAPTPSPTPAATVAVTPAPGDAIQIASDVIVVGSTAAYNADGTRFAFTARPSDDTAGPDVFVWNTQDAVARAVTTDHRSIFAGWDGRNLLVSRVVDGTPRTFAVNPANGAVGAEQGDAAWLPTISPDGKHAAWWDGTVVLAPDGISWVTDKGRLVLGSWPGSADDGQVISRGAIGGWEVRWDSAGTVVGLWSAGGSGDGPGQLGLYPVDPATGHARLGDPILDKVPAFAGFSLEKGKLIYPGPGTSSKRSLWVVAWDGAAVGSVELPGEGGATVIH